jgi:hypothetical protein
MAQEGFDEKCGSHYRQRREQTDTKKKYQTIFGKTDSGIQH